MPSTLQQVPFLRVAESHSFPSRQGEMKAGTRDAMSDHAVAVPLARVGRSAGDDGRPVAWFVWTAVLVLAAALPSATARGQDDPESKAKRDRAASVQDDAEEGIGKRLIRRAAADGDEDLMGSILRLMGDSSHQLEIKFDPGRETQALQTRIVDRLNEVIKVAASRRRPRLRSPAAGSTDKRRKPGGKPEQTEKGTESGQQGDESATGTAADPRTPKTDVDDAQGDLRELRRTWGHLPMRDREEVIQGIGETSLERYRDWIERYYRALQESED